MSDLPQTDPAPVVPTETPPSSNGGTQGEGGDPSWLPARLQRAEEAARKKVLAELGIEDPNADKQLLAEARKRKHDEMTEAQKAQARIAELEPQAQRAKAVEAALQETVEKRIEALPKSMRDLVPDFDDPVKTLAWLDKNAEKLQRPPAPNLDAGAQGDSKQLPQLTDLEREMARMAKMSEADYAKWKRQQAQS